MNRLYISDYEQKKKKKYSFLRALYSIFSLHDMRYLYLLRKTSLTKNKMIKKIMTNRLKKYGRRYGLEISPDAKIGMYFELGHPFNITINGSAILGNHITIGKGATIGAVINGNKKGCPKIGDYVFIGINSTIVGNINIGNNVMICANAFVNFDVPDNSIVIGNPGIIHSKVNPAKDYFYKAEEQ